MYLLLTRAFGTHAIYFSICLYSDVIPINGIDIKGAQGKVSVSESVLSGVLSISRVHCQ